MADAVQNFIDGKRELGREGVEDHLEMRSVSVNLG